MNRLPSLLFTVLGAYASAHLQFGIGGFWGFAADELSVISVCLLVGALVFVLFALTERSIRAFVSPKHSFLASTLSAFGTSFCLGLVFYGALLPRSLESAATRDLPYVLCFTALAVGYTAGRVVERRLELRGSDA